MPCKFGKNTMISKFLKIYMHLLHLKTNTSTKLNLCSIHSLNLRVKVSFLYVQEIFSLFNQNNC